MAYPRTIRNYNAFVDGISYFGVSTEAKLPQVKLKTEAHRGAGMDGPIGLDMGLEGMTSEISFKEWNPALFKKLGRKERFVFRPVQTGEEIFEIDLVNAKRVIGGVDQLASARAAMGF